MYSVWLNLNSNLPHYDPDMTAWLTKAIILFHYVLWSYCWPYLDISGVQDLGLDNNGMHPCLISEWDHKYYVSGEEFCILSTEQVHLTHIILKSWTPWYKWPISYIMLSHILCEYIVTYFTIAILHWCHLEVHVI